MTKPSKPGQLEARLLKFDSKRAFGLEMEFNRQISQENLQRAISLADKKHQIQRSAHYTQDAGNTYWHVKFDRSCGDRVVSGMNEGGWEIASYKAHGYQDLENITRVVEQINKIGAKCNNRCAVHVHAEIADFSQRDAATLVANWMKVEWIILQMLPKHRRSNEYCVPLCDRFMNVVDKRRNYTPGDFWVLTRPTSSDNPNRRVSLNMVNYAFQFFGRITVENRLPEGSADPKDIKNWIRFFVHFVDWNKDASFPLNLGPVTTVDEALTICGLHHENPFFILSRALRNTKIWFLKRIIQHSNNKTLQDQAKARLDIMTGPTPKTYLRPPMKVVPNEERPTEERPSEWLKRIAEKYRKLDRSARSWSREDSWSDLVTEAKYSRGFWPD